MTFFVRPLKYANFHREYYPSCVTTCNECTEPTVFLGKKDRKGHKDWFLQANCCHSHTDKT